MTASCSLPKPKLGSDVFIDTLGRLLGHMVDVCIFVVAMVSVVYVELHFAILMATAGRGH